MVFNIYTTPQFEKDLEFYKKKKHYSKIYNDVDEIIKELEDGNLIGKEIVNLKLSVNESTYKVRAANTSANVGKSNGFRIIYYVIKNDQEIYLLTIYSKKDQEDISNKEITRLIKENCF